MTLNLARTESAWIAGETSEAFEDRQRLLGDKMIQEFAFADDIPALCKQLAALPAFRVWSAANLEEIFRDALDRKRRGVMTASPYAGSPIFGSHR
jgi:hypothetical protein